LVQRFNAVLLHDSLPDRDRDCTDYYTYPTFCRFFLIFKPPSGSWLLRVNNNNNKLEFIVAYDKYKYRVFYSDSRGDTSLDVSVMFSANIACSSKLRNSQQSGKHTSMVSGSDPNPRRNSTRKARKKLKYPVYERNVYAQTRSYNEFATEKQQNCPLLSWQVPRRDDHFVDQSLDQRRPDGFLTGILSYTVTGNVMNGWQHLLDRKL